MAYATRNPFTPAFGSRPESLVGRQPLLARIDASLERGPRDRAYIRLLLGQRGSGKTTLLSEIRDRAETQGMLTLGIEATGTSSISTKIADAVDATRDHHAELLTEQSSSERILSGLRVGPVGLNWQTFPHMRSKRSTRRQLEQLVSWASENQTAVLLTIDEMHGGKRDDIRQLAADLQHVTNIRGLPLAFVGAGLPEMTHTVLEDRKMTFFHRCARDHLPPISFADAWKCLGSTIRSANGDISREAMTMLASEAQNNVAYKLQVLGYHAWEFSDAPNQAITDADARMALVLAEQDMQSQVLVAMWNDLSDKEQEFLSVLADNDGRADPQQIAARMPAVSSNELARMLRRLKSAGHVERTEQDELVLVGGLTVSTVGLLSDETRLFRTNESLDTSFATTANTSGRVLCNNYMPRSKAKCVLRRGHKGRCRSRI